MTSAQGKFVWYELATKDMGEAKAFYAEILGWAAREVSQGGRPYSLLTAGDAPVAGLLPLPDEAGALRRAHDRFRMSGRREIHLQRSDPEQSVAHGAADDAGLAPGRGERRQKARELGLGEERVERPHWKCPGKSRPFSMCAGT